MGHLSGFERDSWVSPVRWPVSEPSAVAGRRAQCGEAWPSSPEFTLATLTRRRAESNESLLHTMIIHQHLIQLNPAITDLKGPMNFMRYCQIALLPKQLSPTILFAIFCGNYRAFKNKWKQPFALQSNEKHFENAMILKTTQTGGQGPTTPSHSLDTCHSICIFSHL